MYVHVLLTFFGKNVPREAFSFSFNSYYNNFFKCFKIIISFTFQRLDHFVKFICSESSKSEICLRILLKKESVILINIVLKMKFPNTKERKIFILFFAYF